jgi:hypothetical protein
MIKKLSFSSLAILGLSSIFFACEDSSILDVTSDNIESLPTVTVISIDALSSVGDIADLSSSEGSSEDGTSSAGTSLTAGSSAGTSVDAPSSQGDIFSSAGVSVDAGSSTPLSSIAASSIALSSKEIETCDGLAVWNSVAWNLTGGGVRFVNTAKTSAWTCDGTGFCGFEPGSVQAPWVKAFDC